MCAGYLFQPDKQYDVTYDTGDKAIQCGRHVDIFKFWLMWKAKVSRVDRRVHTCWLKKTEKHLQANKNLHGFVSAMLFSAILSVLNCNYWLLFSPAGHHWVWAAHWQVFGSVSVPIQQDQEQGGIWDGVWRSGELPSFYFSFTNVQF